MVYSIQYTIALQGIKNIVYKMPYPRALGLVAAWSIMSTPREKALYVKDTFAFARALCQARAEFGYLVYKSKPA